MITRPVISQIIIMGDSLSDRGTMFDKRFLGMPVMRWLSGLAGISPQGSFTNGFPWSDHFLAELASQFIIKEFKRERNYHSDDIADAVVNNDTQMQKATADYYHLTDDAHVRYRGCTFARTYTIGGLTSYDYSWWPSTSIKRFFSRLILPTLEDKRKELLEYDAAHKISPLIKAETLIVEWSGANDLITVNKRASISEADRAIAERIKNVKRLIAAGYRHFILFNLPDLSLTPRYQENTLEEQRNASTCSDYFNQKLLAECELLSKQFPHCSVRIYDINREFVDIYTHPEKYGFDPTKRNKPFIDSKDFVMNKEGHSPAKGYIFWDKLHPSADVHAHLADNFLGKFTNNYAFHSPRHGHPRKIRRTVSETSLKTNLHGFFNHPANDAELSKDIQGKQKKRLSIRNTK